MRTNTLTRPLASRALLGLATPADSRGRAARRALQFNGNETIALPEDVAGASTVALQTAVSAAVEALQNLGKLDAPSDADLAEGQRLLNDVITPGKSELAKRSSEAGVRKTGLSDLLAAVDAPVEVPAVETAAAEQPATETAAVETPAAETQATDTAVTAAAGTATAEVPRAADVRAAGGGDEAPTRTRNAMALVAAPDAPGVPQGHKYGDFMEAAEGILERTALYPEGGSDTRQTFRNGALRLPRVFEAGLVASGYDVDAAMEYATSFDRIGGQDALLAAGGWGTPSETLYDLVELEAADGMFDVPEIQVVRGGVRYTRGPEFSAFRGRGFAQTEAQAIAGTPKPFFRVPGADFVEERAGVVGLGVTSGVLQNKAYPELTARVLRGLLVAHAHEVNGKTLGDIAAGSTAVTMSGGAGALIRLLSAMELQAIDTRTKHSMPETAVLETALPMWCLGALRQDLAYRHSVPVDRIPDSAITEHFADRKVRVQWVKDWQDEAFGGETPATAYPSTVKFLMYPAGTWVRGMGSVLSIDSLYDSAGLAANDFTALFTEESYLVTRRGHESRVVEVPLAADGSTLTNPVPAPAV